MDPTLQNQNGLYSRIEAWAKKPFSQDMNLTDLALTVGFVTVAAFLYWTALRYITETGEEL